MPFCVAFFESTVDALLALVGAAMTLVSSLIHPIPGQHQITSSLPAIRLIAYATGQDAADLVTRLRDADPRTRTLAACELQRLGSASRPVIAALVERLADASPVDPKVCGQDRHYWSKDFEQQTTPGEEAAAALVAIGTDSLASLVTASSALQWVARRNAVWALGALDDARGAPAVLAALQDREPPVRRSAAWALGTIRDRRATDALAAALKDASPQVRRQAAWALGSLGR
jgi:HEAT repeat protein